MLVWLPPLAVTTPVSQDDGAHTCSQHSEKSAKSHMEEKQHSWTCCCPTLWWGLACDWEEQENDLSSHSGSWLSECQEATSGSDLPIWPAQTVSSPECAAPQSLSHLNAHQRMITEKHSCGSHVYIRITGWLMMTRNETNSSKWASYKGYLGSRTVTKLS